MIPVYNKKDYEAYISNLNRNNIPIKSPKKINESLVSLLTNNQKSSEIMFVNDLGSKANDVFGINLEQEKYFALGRFAREHFKINTKDKKIYREKGKPFPFDNIDIARQGGMYVAIIPNDLTPVIVEFEKVGYKLEN